MPSHTTRLAEGQHRSQTGARPRKNECMYCLQAVIAAEPVLRELVGSVQDAHVVPLGQHLSILPMANALFDAITVVGAPELDGFLKAPAGFGCALTACSSLGPVAYVEAEYFGGTGTQFVQVWDARKVVLSPMQLADRGPEQFGSSPISQALRRLGAVKGDHIDEFDAVGLGRHRDTNDWLLRQADRDTKRRLGVVHKVATIRAGRQRHHLQHSKFPGIA